MRELNFVDVVRRREIGSLRPLASQHAFARSSGLASRLGLTHTLEEHDGCVNTINWSCNGEFLLSGSDDTRLCLWDYQRKQLRLAWHAGHTANIFCAKFMPNTDNSVIVSCAGDGQIRVHSVSQTVYAPDVDAPVRHPPPEQAIPGRRARLRTPIEARHSETAPRMLQTYRCHDDRVKKLVMEPGNAHFFLSCGEDATVRQFDLREPHECDRTCSNAIVRVVGSHSQSIEINSISLSATRPSYFIIGGADKYVRLYDRRMLRRQSDSVAAVQRFSPHGIDSNHLTAVSFARNGREFVASYSRNHVYLFDMFDTPPALAPEPRPCRRANRATHSLREAADRSRSAPRQTTSRTRRAAAAAATTTTHAPATSSSAAAHADLAVLHGSDLASLDEFRSRAHDALDHGRFDDALSWCSCILTRLNSAAVASNNALDETSAGNDNEAEDDDQSPDAEAIDQTIVWNALSSSRGSASTSRASADAAQSTRSTETLDAPSSWTASAAYSPTPPSTVTRRCAVYILRARTLLQRRDRGDEDQALRECDRALGLVQTLGEPRASHNPSAPSDELHPANLLGRACALKSIVLSRKGLRANASTCLHRARRLLAPSDPDIVEALRLMASQGDADGEENDETASEPSRMMTRARAAREREALSNRDTLAEYNPLPNVASPSAQSDTTSMETDSLISVEVDAMMSFDEGYSSSSITDEDAGNEHIEDGSDADGFVAEDGGGDDNDDDDEDEQQEDEEEEEDPEDDTDSEDDQPLDGLPPIRPAAITSAMPTGGYIQAYVGHLNVQTVKDVAFFGPESEFVVSGSDDGRIFIWRKDNAKLVQLLDGDRDVVNCMTGHPFDPVMATSGIESSVKIWQPIKSKVAADFEEVANSAIQRNERERVNERRHVIPRRYLVQYLRQLQGGDVEGANIAENCTIM
ncbi:hypothetical protein CAOG_07902 [Capsaspora owczarzaki ATCC 30864]|uniref:Uncharacterized protein n=1 Tax=Capsaspora owczarzaki (strain ATCC 30864) TaxID=595528 RepID=A0A0D2WY63_CAPO3|nr:hypothetical protein CAOG_07902 [Capsaspora owczarzaki ATCC 30864]KJE97808.1 hypothetical protein CAOG_007902 [Capsaspora owczarzaki ATCC 30864]|eukprot:XP_004342987.1 hypothetical protein CAOG_07902 [Capsaspora owczarzaki ATCC 30864]